MFFHGGLPIISAEGEERQVASILHVTRLEVLETIAHGYGILHFGRGDADSLIPISAAWLPKVLRTGGIKNLIVASHLEALHVFEWCISPIIVLKMDEHSIAFYQHILERRAFIHDTLEAIVAIQSRVSQPFAHLLFLSGVYLRELVGID